MRLETVPHTWIVNLFTEAGIGILPRLNQRDRVIKLLLSQGFTVVTEPESRVSAFRIRVQHARESAMTLFLLNKPNSVESVKKL